MSASRARLMPGRFRHLAVIPEREIPLAPHVPRGRTLHLLDLENLCGGPGQIPQTGHAIADRYRIEAGIAQEDHVVLGANPSSLIHCSDIFPGARLVGRHGPNGADRSLLNVIGDADWVARHYDRVVIGSGDHCFAPSATALGVRGILVCVISRHESLSRSLAISAPVVRLLRHITSLEVVR